MLPKRGEMTIFKIKVFDGTSRSQDSAEDFIDDLEYSVRKEYARELSVFPRLRGKKIHNDLTIEEEEIVELMKNDLRIAFRQNIAGQADSWFNKLSPDQKKDWGFLKQSFLEQFHVEPESKYAAKFRMEQEYNQLAQGPHEAIGEYLGRADDFYHRHGEKKPNLGFRTMYGLQDGSQRDLVYVLAKHSEKETFAEFRQIIVDVYSGARQQALDEDPESVTHW